MVYIRFMKITLLHLASIFTFLLSVLSIFFPFRSYQQAPDNIQWEGLVHFDPPVEMSGIEFILPMFSNFMLLVILILILSNFRYRIVGLIFAVVNLIFSALIFFLSSVNLLAPVGPYEPAAGIGAYALVLSALIMLSCTIFHFRTPVGKAIDPNPLDSI